MENLPNEQTALIPQSPLSLSEAGQLADQFTATSTFARYQERHAANTLPRHQADLALFTTYLHAIPGLNQIGDLYHDPFAWSGMSKGLVEGFVHWQLSQGYAIRSVNARLSTVRLYCKLAQGAGILDENQAAMIRTVTGYRAREGRRIDAQRKTTRMGAKKAQWTQLTVAQAGAAIGHGGEIDQPSANFLQAVFRQEGSPNRPPDTGARLHSSSSAGTFTHLPAT